MLRALCFDNRPPVEVPVGAASIGCAHYPEYGDSTLLLRHADQAMYAAKAQVPKQ